MQHEEEAREFIKKRKVVEAKSEWEQRGRLSDSAGKLWQRSSAAAA